MNRKNLFFFSIIGFNFALTKLYIVIIKQTQLLIVQKKISLIKINQSFLIFLIIISYKHIKGIYFDFLKNQRLFLLDEDLRFDNII